MSSDFLLGIAFGFWLGGASICLRIQASRNKKEPLELVVLATLLWFLMFIQPIPKDHFKD